MADDTQGFKEVDTGGFKQVAPVVLETGGFKEVKAPPVQTASQTDPKGRELLSTGQLPSGTELITTPQGRHNLWEGIKQEPGRILSGMVETAKKPGEIAASKKPVTTGEMIAPAADIAMGFGLKLGKQPFSMEVPKGTGGFKEIAAPGPTKEFVTQQEDALFKIVQESEADKLDILKKTEALPEELKNPVMQEKFYHHIEETPQKTDKPKDGFVRFYHGGTDPTTGGPRWTTTDPEYARNFRAAGKPNEVHYVDIPKGDPTEVAARAWDILDERGKTNMVGRYNHIEIPEQWAKQLKPEANQGRSKILSDYEKTQFDQTVGLMQKERAELYNRITKSGYPIEDLTSQVHRVVKGMSPQFDALEGSLAADPISGMGRGLPRNTSSMMERAYYALEDQNGNRFVVKKSDAGGTLYHGGKATPTTIPHEITPGNSFSVGPKTFKVVQATTKEIEENTGTRYYKNAWANTADDVVRLKRVARAVEYLDNIKQTPEWQRFATMDKMKAPPNWIRTQLPQLEGWRMEPKLAHVFDDFYGHGRGNLAEKLAKINRFATRSIFWNPNPHIENVAGHWAVGRGWDWVTPQGLRSAFIDSAKAIKSTITLDKNYEQMLRDGSALQMARVANQDFYQQLAKKVGMEFEKDPKRWGNIFKTMGFNGIADGINAYYNGVSKVLWGANDVFMMQRVYELERKGLSRGMAIKEAEKHIPNYRIPSEILGSRAWSELMQNPNIFIFNRYHYGQWGSYARMVADLYKGSPKEKFDALGNMVALGVLSFVIYPYISAGLQKLTGDPKTQKLARGPASIPTALYELWTGDRSLNAFISSVMTMAPGSKEIGEQLSTLDWFTGRHIVEPDDVKNHRWGRVAAQIVNHAAETMVSPYQVLDQYIKDKDAKGPIRVAIDALVGMKEPTERQERGKRAAQGFQRKDAAKRAAKPRGLIEQIPNYGGPEQ